VRIFLFFSGGDAGWIYEGFIEEIYGKILAKGMQLRERADYDVYYKEGRS